MVVSSAPSLLEDQSTRNGIIKAMHTSPFPLILFGFRIMKSLDFENSKRIEETQ